MQMSEEIIKILDYLCEKFGVAVDWTSGNIMPYLEELCEKLVRYEICSSVIWIVIAAIIITLCAIACVKVVKSCCKGLDYDTKYLIVTLLICLALGFAAVLIVQIFDITECFVIPEKYLVEYVSNLARKVG